MLDGVFECRNHFFNVRWQFDSPLDDRPDGDRRRQNDVRIQVNRLQIVVKIGSSTAMQRIAGLPNTWAAVLPMTRSANVRALLVGKKYIGAAIEALGVPLQTSRTLGQLCEVGIVSNDDEYVDVLRIGFGCRDRAENSNSPNAGNTSGRRHESAQAIEQLCRDDPVVGCSSTPFQSSGGTSLTGTNTSIDRAWPGLRRIKPRRSRVTIML